MNKKTLLVAGVAVLACASFTAAQAKHVTLSYDANYHTAKKKDDHATVIYQLVQHREGQKKTVIGPERSVKIRTNSTRLIKLPEGKYHLVGIRVNAIRFHAPNNELMHLKHYQIKGCGYANKSVHLEATQTQGKHGELTCNTK